jgi:long-chain acyl-CoA synthetase
LVLQETAQQRPAHAALAAGDARMSYGELAVAAERLAAGMMRLGVQPGDRVALLLPNCPQFVMAYLAAARLGAAAVPLNPLLTPAEAGYIVNDAEARAIVAVEPTAPLAAGLAQSAETVEHVIVSGEQRPKGAVDFAGLMEADAEGLPEPPGADDPAALMYTSGTTGRPKGAQLSHRNLLFDAQASVAAVQIGPDDVMLTVLPLFHSFGLTVCMVVVILVGATSVLLPRFDGLAVLQALEDESVTLFPGVPAMFAALATLKTDRTIETPRLRVCISGGAPLPEPVLHAFEERYQTTLLEGYGPTEAAPVVSVNRSAESRKIGSVGPPLDGVEVQIQDDDGQPVPTGEVGEVCVRGPNVMSGYWRDPEQTRATLRGGWLLTGDLGHMDDDGHLYIVDRKKDMIIVGGLNVYPSEVEEVIGQLTEVADCAVIGVPSPLRGERVKAFVQLREGQSLTAERIVEHCRAHLAQYKTPRWVELVGDLPRSITGKVLKRELRDRETGGTR